MEVYLVRQPVFDENQNIFGYELLNNLNLNSSGLDTQATADLINNIFISMDIKHITKDTKAFIDFNKELIIEEVPLLLPKEHMIIVAPCFELHESTYIKALKNIKKEGYEIAFEVKTGKQIDNLEQIEPNIIIVEYSTESITFQKKVINVCKNETKSLAKSISTRNELDIAKRIGFTYFKGTFFSKPIIIKNNDISEIPISYMEMINEMGNQDPSFGKLNSIVERDLGITYKLLKTANSPLYGSRYKIESIKQALVRIGLNELRRWSYLMILKTPKKNENSELIKTCLIRGKFMELLAIDIKLKEKSSEFFIAGIFSAIDILLNKKMEDVIGQLMFSDNVGNALLGNENIIKEALDLIVNYEKANWEKIEKSNFSNSGNVYNITNIYMNALSWADDLNY